MSGAIVVTEVARYRGRDIPVEALVFLPEVNAVIYSRLLVRPEVVAELPANFPADDLFFDAVMN